MAEGINAGGRGQVRRQGKRQFGIADHEIGDHVQTRWIHSQGTGLITSVPFEAHFGVGEADFIDRLQVDWLDGTSQIWLDVPSHQRLRVTHP